jgi:Bacterial SH3 domain
MAAPSDHRVSAPRRFRCSQRRHESIYCVAVLCIAVLVASVASVSSAQFRDPRRRTSVGFSVELPISTETLSAAVRRVASDGSIGGTFEYRGESEVSGATLEASADAFESSSPADAVTAFYKVRKLVLAPAHFPSSNDMGTITVRYEVETTGAQRSVLRIDAVFVRDGQHAPYYSDGTVEASEYRRIQELLPGFSLLTHDGSKAPAAAPQPVAPTATPAPAPVPEPQVDPVTAPVQPAGAAAPVGRAAGLENTLEEEKAQLAAVNSSVEQLQERAKQLRFDTLGRVKFPKSPLKAAAYTESDTLRVLDRGAEVTVLTTTRYWYRVRSADGHEGWIYYMFLEPLS